MEASFSPAGTYTTPNRVVLISPAGRQEEAVAASICPVGGLVALDVNGNAKAHDTPGGRCEKAFAVERNLQGLSYPDPVGVFDSYVAGDIVQYHLAEPGDVVLGLLASGQNLVAMTPLMSAGNGTLTEYVPGSGARLTESTATSTVITNTSSATSFSTCTYTVGANVLVAGSTLHVKATGTVVGVNGTDTQTITLLLGSTTIGTIPATNYAAGETFEIEAFIAVNVVGVSGSIKATGTYKIGTAAPVGFTLGATAIDTTASQAVAVQATCSAANAADQIEANYFVVDLERAQDGGNWLVAYLLDATNNASGTTGQSYSPAAQARVRVA